LSLFHRQAFCLSINKNESGGKPLQTYQSLEPHDRKLYDPFEPFFCEQLGMFESLGIAEDCCFVWEADLKSGMIVKTNMDNNTHTRMQYEDFLQKIRNDDILKLETQINADLGQSRRTIDVNIHIKANGAYRPHRIKGMIFDGRTGCYAAGYAYDLEAARAKTAKLEYLKTHDLLTGLYNTQTLEAQFKDISRYGMYPQTLIVAHIDCFKEINDALGYHAGNTLIQNVAEVVRECFLDAEIVARIGGGEYCAVYAGKSLMETDHKIKQAQMALHGMYLNLIKAEVSFGYAAANQSSDFSVLYKQAAKKIIHSSNAQKILSNNSVIDSINRIIETKSGWGKRQTRLLSLSAQIANHLACSEECITETKVLAKIADIGLVGLEDRLLINRLKLGREELAEYQKHIEIGRTIISSTEETALFEGLYLDIFKRYDEWKDAIALPSRIIAVVIGFDDMVSAGGSICYDGIKSRLNEKRCSEYCPEVTDAILSVAAKHYI